MKMVVERIIQQFDNSRIESSAIGMKLFDSFATLEEFVLHEVLFSSIEL